MNHTIMFGTRELVYNYLDVIGAKELQDKRTNLVSKQTAKKKWWEESATPSNNLPRYEIVYPFIDILTNDSIRQPRPSGLLPQEFGLKISLPDDCAIVFEESRKISEQVAAKLDSCDFAEADRILSEFAARILPLSPVMQPHICTISNRCFGKSGSHIHTCQLPKLKHVVFIDCVFNDFDLHLTEARFGRCIFSHCEFHGAELVTKHNDLGDDAYIQCTLLDCNITGEEGNDVVGEAVRTCDCNDFPHTVFRVEGWKEIPCPTGMLQPGPELYFVRCHFNAVWRKPINFGDCTFASCTTVSYQTPDHTPVGYPEKGVEATDFEIPRHYYYRQNADIVDVSDDYNEAIHNALNFYNQFVAEARLTAWMELAEDDCKKAETIYWTGQGVDALARYQKHGPTFAEGTPARDWLSDSIVEVTEILDRIADTHFDHELVSLAVYLVQPEPDIFYGLDT